MLSVPAVMPDMGIDIVDLCYNKVGKSQHVFKFDVLIKITR